MGYLVAWICFGLVSAMIASNKGNSGCAAFFIGILLGPFGLLFAFFSDDNEQVKMQRKGYTKKCPYCAELVKEEAILCKHCGKPLSNQKDFDIEKFRG